MTIEHHDIAEILLKDTLNTALCIPVLDFSFSTKVVKNLFNSCCNWTDDLCISFKEGFPSTSAQLYTKFVFSPVFENRVALILF
jgi:hypothetical protein